MSTAVAPVSIGLVVGVQAIFNCLVPSEPGSNLNWNFQSESNGMTSVIVQNCVSNDPNRYSVQKTTANTCKLVVNNAQTMDAGIYTCYTMDQQWSESAGLTVLDSDPRCEQSALSGPVGQLVYYSCVVQFVGAARPTFIASSGPPSQNLNVTGYFNETLSSIFISAPIVEPKLDNVYVDTVFLYPYPNVTATNYPDYRYSWTSEVVLAESSAMFVGGRSTTMINMILSLLAMALLNSFQEKQ